MKRLLIISYYWPPTGGSGVQRWVKFAKYLPSEGWQPVVYTPLNPERLAVDESLCREIPSEVEVLQTKIVEPYNLYRKFFGKKKAEGGVNPLNSQKKSWKQKIAIWVRGNFFVPDPRVCWVKPSVRFLKKYLMEHPVDAIVTTGPPQSMHLIGLGLRKALGKDAPRWIADFRDPWTKMFMFKHMGLWPLAERRHRRMEQDVLDNCDLVLAVTPMVQEDFRQSTSTPVALITNGYDESDFALADAHPAEDCFNIVHTGLFASDGNPLALWDVLAAMCASDEEFRRQLRIRLIGKVDTQIVDAIHERGLGENLANLGYLPHDETVAEQLRANLLMLPLRQEPEYLKVYPGKIFEYLAAKRPVLGIGQEEGAAASLLRECGVGDMFGWNERAAVADFVASVWKKHLSGEEKALECEVGRFSRRALTKELVKIL